MAIYTPQYTKAIPQNAEIIQIDGNEHAQWIDRFGRIKNARLTTGKNGSKRAVMSTKKYYAKVRNEHGQLTRVATGCKTRESAMQIEARIHREVEKVKSGLITDVEATASQHVQTPIKTHVEAYLAHLSCSASPHHIRNVRHQIETVVNSCNITRLNQMNASALETFLSNLRAKGRSARTSNCYLAAMKAMGQWCVKTGRLFNNPFRTLSKCNEKADPRHHRRALNEQEMGRLLEVSQKRPIAEHGREIEYLDVKGKARKRSNWRRVELTPENFDDCYARGHVLLASKPALMKQAEQSGIERPLIYKTLALTGLRKSELQSITFAQTDLTATPPRLHLLARHAKNRTDSVIPLPPQLAEEIQAFLDSKTPKPKPTDKLFNVSDAIDKIFNRDLAVAAIAKQDAMGRYVDVHALRHTFATMLSRSGVTLRTAQAAMRHSDPRLTANVYVHPELEDVVAAVNSLPSLSIPAGTRDGPENEPLHNKNTSLKNAGEASKTRQEKRKLIPNLVPDTGKKGHSVAPSVTMSQPDTPRQVRPLVLYKLFTTGALAPSDTSCHQEAMVRPAGIEPTTFSSGG